MCCRDEENLEENERIKKELNPRKIGVLALVAGVLPGSALLSAV
jgi:hypothetical protein